MPFTFSHPAIIFPFLRNKKLSATALIVGSMSPDFEYFFRMKIQSEISHTFLGIFLIDFPLGFIVMFVFHKIIKKPLIENSPAFFSLRMQKLKELNWNCFFKNNVFIVLISFFLGTVSHLLWDSFTHWDGYFVQRIFFLNLELYSVPLYKIAQHLSSLIGMIFIAHYIYKLPVRKETITKPKWKYWLIVLVLTFVFISIRWTFGLSFNQIGNIVVSLISSTILALTFAGLNFRSKRVI
ncbi:MAG: DUF4184 family protein [Flavobacterium sp.]|nr:DUF4184 family protein [Flavobacterium sp.]